MKRIYADKNFCINCGLCEIACLTVKSESGDIHTAYLEERKRGLVPRIRVVNNGTSSSAFCCRQCDEPECVASCFSGALQIDFLSHLISYDPTCCVGCYACVAACSYGVVRPSPSGNDIVRCDLCSGRLEGPACVEACPNMALIFEER